MPTRDIRNTSPNGPTKSPRANEFDKQDQVSQDSSHGADFDSDAGFLGDFSHTPFPSLTGLRPRASTRKLESVTIDLRVRLVDLENATASLGALPITTLQAAWAVVLSTYMGAWDNVIFTTLIAFQDYGYLNEDASDATYTRVTINIPQKWAQLTASSMFQRLTESNRLALRQVKQPEVSAVHHKEPSKHGTMIALIEKGNPEDGKRFLELSNGLSEGEELALSLVAWPDRTGLLKLKVLYTDTVLNENAALLMLQQFDDVLAFLIRNSAVSIVKSLAAIRPSLLSIPNEALVEPTILNAKASYLHTQFEDFAKESPYRVALEFRKEIHSQNSSNDTTWTYEQLNDRAKRFAAYLTERFGELAGEVIPICMERCPELYVAILGILKAGGAWCPIDASFPARRRHDLIARTGARVLVIAEQKLEDNLKGIPKGVVTVNATNLTENVGDRIETPCPNMGTLAYLIWTSGTTGDPKGVPIHHHAAVTSMRALQRSIPTDVTGGIVRCLQFSQFTFDVFVQDLFYTWGVGGTVISSTREIMLGSFAGLATGTNATHAHLTPAFAASVSRKSCPTLQVITMIGEKLPQIVADDWSQDMRAFNTYGPAEATVVSTLRQFGARGDEIKSDNIGFPLPSVSAFVLRDGQPLMKHGVGELALGGPQLSKGYWNDPERSSGRFVWNIQYSRPLYMTGDMVRQLHDSSLEFLGRTDDLIKIQGIRVELSEIGFALRSCHPLVEQIEIQYLDRQDRPSKVIVAFLATPNLDKSKEFTSHLIAGEGAIAIAKSTLVEAQKTLPSYMIPSVFLVLNRIPRTASAKTDKAVLKDLYGSVDLGTWERMLSLTDNNGSEVTTRSTRESELITIVGQISGTTRSSMSRASDLRSIGIDSITATRLTPLLNSIGISLSVADILRCQTLDDLLKLTHESPNMHPTHLYDLEAFHNKWFTRVRKVINKSDVFVAPALPLQESLLTESTQSASAYWSHVFLALDSQIDLTRLYEAWSQVVSDTEALRTGFIPVAAVLEPGDDAPVANSTFMQLIYEKAAIDWTYFQSLEVDIKDCATKRAREVVEGHQKHHFEDPLLSITVLEKSENHMMMISIHHSIRDEVSLDFILEDVNRNYQKVGEGSQPRHQMHEALQVMVPTGAQITQDEEFWSKVLKDFVIIDGANTWPDLTSKNSRIEDPAAGLIHHTEAFKMRYRDLQSAALSLGASSIASVIRVAWGSILLDYLETDSVVFAETWSNRIDDVRLADVVGPLINVLPVPFRALGSAREAMISQSQFQKESRTHRSIHSRIIRKLLGCSQNEVLYPAVFNFIPDARKGCPDGCSSLWDKVESLVGLTVEHPVALNVAQTVDGFLEMEISASQNFMSSAHLAILALQVEAYVEAMLRLPDVPLKQLSSYFPKSVLSVTSVSFSEEVRLALKQNPTDWVDHYAASHPDWPAVQVVTSLSIDEYESEIWSFTELHSAYTRVASFITRNRYVKQMIAVCLDCRIEAYAIILGILASNNVYLPIDENLPQDRKSFLLGDSSAVVLFTTKSLALTFSTILHGCRIIYVDDGTYMERTVEDHSAQKLSCPQAKDNAYLLYTSGSTGVPKGVLVGRGNLCSFIEGLSEYIRLVTPGADELPGKGKYLGLASKAFDVHICEMFLAWRMGLAAVTAPRTMLLDNLELALRKLRITHASFVPSLIDQAGLDPANLPDLHYLGVGGEKMSKHCIGVWAGNKSAALVNAYGPTEMTIGCTAALVTRQSNLRNVGRPYGNSVAHVLVPGSDRYTLRGVAGELCFTGDLVANGYHNRPDAKGFVNDFNGERMYRTGDIVRLMADDSVEYLRREDDQIKIRGQRLELGEISEAVRSSTVLMLGLNKIDVATIVAQHPRMSKSQLVSFFGPLPHSQKAPESPDTLLSTFGYSITRKIQASCRKVLPAYMVPDLLIPLTKIPLAPSSGKADNKLLKAMFADIPIANLISYNSSGQPHQSEPTRRELTEAEKVVRTAITSTLAVDATEISANTNIFRLGLDSLSAISLAIKMQKLGYDCTVSGVLRNPLLEQLALLPRKNHGEIVSLDRLTQTRSRLADLESRFRATYPASLSDSSIQAVKLCLPLQETLVATSLNEASETFYINHVALKLSSQIDHGRLHKAWVRVVADHDILRTCFQEFENGFVQLVLRFDKARSEPWKETNTSNPEYYSQLQQDKTALDIISEISIKAPMRMNLFRPPSDERSAILLLSIHHALYDKESIAMVFEELNIRYHSAIPPAHTSFDSIIEHVCSQDQEASKVFWKKYLAGYRSSPILNQIDASNENLGNEIFPAMDRTFASPLVELEDFSSSISGTLTSTIQAVFGIILAQMLKTNDVVFGAVLSGRTIPIQNPHTIVAPCITTIPQRVNISDDAPTIVDIIKLVQQGFVESLEFQHTALRHIHRWAEAERPLFDCLVSYVHKKESKASPYPKLWTMLEGSLPDEFPFSVEFEADHEGDRLRAHCAFSPAISQDRAASFLENIDLLLGALVRRENVTTNDLGISKSSAIDSRLKPHVWDDSYWTPRELKVRELAAGICGITAVNISKGVSFFNLGIDSITAISLARSLRESGVDCSSADVMRYSCIGALAQKVDALSRRSNNIEKPTEQEDNLKHIIPKIPILSPKDVVTDIYACTPLQSSMLTQTLGSDGTLYFNHHVVQLNPHVDIRRLKLSWVHLTMETEILRTTFHFFNTASSWLAAVHKEVPNTWTECNVRTSVPVALSVIRENSVFHEAANFQQPPWKITVLKTITENVLVISMHHSLYDGVSMDLLFQDLARQYEGVDLQRRQPFSDAARAISKSNTDAEQFWLETLDGFENGEVSSEQDADMMEVESIFGMNPENTLRGCKALDVTVQTVALLAFGKILACFSGCRDVVFGHVVGGRSLAVPGADEIIGPVFNTVPFRIMYDKIYVTNKAAALEIQQISGDSQSHQHAALSRIQQEWRQKIGDPNARLFDALFVFQNDFNKVSSTEELWTYLDIGEAIAPTEYSTNFEIQHGKEQIILRLVSHKGLRTREQLQHWLTTFEQVFYDILEHPERSVMAVPTTLMTLPFKIGSRKSHSAPQGEIGSGPDLQCIRRVLSEISRIPQEDISVSASIFSLGLDSISAIQVAAACRKEGYGISVADVLQGRSLAGICQRLQERNVEHNSRIENQGTLISAKSKSKALVIVNMKEKDVEDVLPCLAGQVYHLASWLKSGRTICEAQFTYKCSESLNVDDLRSAWRRLRERHSVLRTVFVTISPKESLQVVLRSSALNDDPFEYIEITGNVEDRVTNEIQEEAQQSFNIFSPPSKLTLVREDTQDFVVLKLHHATYDAWTIQTIVEDLAALYNSISLPTPPSFKSFIHHTLRTLSIEAEQAYWRKSLEHCQETFLQPLDVHSHTSGSNSLFASTKSAIPQLRTLENTYRASSTSLPIIILLAFARTLSRHTSIANPTFGLYQTGRSASFPGIEQLCAPCLNVLPVVVPHALDWPILQSVERLQEDLAERVDFEQNYLSEVLLERVGKWENGPLFNSFVNILMYEKAMRSQGSLSNANSSQLFVPYQYQLEDFSSTISSRVEPMANNKTAVDGIEIGYLAARNFYLDVVRSVENDCIDFAIRCDAELMDERMVRAFAAGMVGEVEKITGELTG